MKQNRRFILSLLLYLSAGLATSAPVDFNREIRPILSDKCFSCHGPDKKHRKGKLRLDLEEAPWYCRQNEAKNSWTANVEHGQAMVDAVVDAWIAHLGG